MQDRARIFVQAGRGGDGCLSFRREAHVPKGGPDGGDGGRGGDVVLVCDDSLRDLEAFRRRSHFRASSGGHGRGALKHGADGGTLELTVPPGTQVLVERDSTTHDLVRPGQRAVVARGGPGGRGNKRFAGPTHQTPRFAERGLAGGESWVSLQLKLLADVGLVGLPNAGKSSLLARLTRAHPKIADYPFTTLEPVLGTLERGDRQLVIADIPGLIAGASAGAGLGHEFLAHVERTRLLVEVLDLAPLDGSDPAVNHETVERELELHDPRLAALPRVLALSKADLVEASTAEEARAEWQRRLGVPVFVTSAVTGQGLGELSAHLMHQIEVYYARAAGAGFVGEDAGVVGEGAGAGIVEAAATAGEGAGTARIAAHDPATGTPAELAEHRVFRPAVDRAYKVERIGERSFRVSGAGIERLVARYDLDNDEALAHLERRLRGIGVIRALEAAGFQPGDDVEIGGVEFELDPGQ
jgi:GTP-binding protein